MDKWDKKIFFSFFLINLIYLIYFVPKHDEKWGGVNFR